MNECANKMICSKVGTVGGIATSQLRGPQFDHELRLLLHLCGFLSSLTFLPLFRNMHGGLVHCMVLLLDICIRNRYVYKKSSYGQFFVVVVELNVTSSKMCIDLFI